MIFITKKDLMISDWPNIKNPCITNRSISVKYNFYLNSVCDVYVSYLKYRSTISHLKTDFQGRRIRALGQLSNYKPLPRKL